MADQPIIHVETFDQGLVTARDPALLERGELTKADNTYYLPNEPSIQKVKGRTKFNSTPISGSPNVVGLRYLQFDDNNNLLVAHAGTTYYQATMVNSETGTFSSLATSVGTGLTLDAIQYGNRQYLLNGAGQTSGQQTQNVVVLSDATTRLHGLQPIASPPVITSTAGSWNTALGTGYYFFFTVELYNPGTSDALESTNIVPDYTLASTSFQFTTSNINTTTIIVTRPTQVNSQATHWMVYASPAQPTNTVPNRVLFKQIGPIQDIASTTLTIGNTQVQGTNSRFPTTNSAITSWANSGGGSPTNVESIAGSNPDDNALILSGTNGVTPSGLWSTFGFSGIAGTITSVDVEIKMTYYGLGTDKPKLGIALTTDGSTFTTPQYLQPSSSPLGVNQVNPTNLQVYIARGLWGRAWTTANFNANANFGVKLTSSIFHSVGIAVDYIRVTVQVIGTSATTPITTGGAFPTITISIGGLSSSIGSHGCPPVATTGEVYEDQMVTNDISDLSIIRYSLPNAVDYFPSLYFINFETKQTDVVTKIIRLGDKLLVGQKTQLFRVNYLPRENDAEFDRGRCYETISEGQGIVGTQAAATFTSPGGPLLMAFVSYSGIHATDGFQVDTIVDDLDWPSTVSLPTAAAPTDYLQNCILVDYPMNYQLWLYYTPPGGTTNTKALVIHYHPSHRKPNGKMKVTGPITVAAFSATTARVSNAPVLVTGQSTGTVYVEDRGYTHNAGSTIAVDIKTRELYPWGLYSSGTVEYSLIRHNIDPTSTITLTSFIREDNAAQTQPIATETFNTTNAGVAYIPIHVYGDSIQFEFTEPGADGGVNLRLAQYMLYLIPRGLPAA